MLASASIFIKKWLSSDKAALKPVIVAAPTPLLKVWWIILTPSKVLYFVDDIPLISITSPSNNPWGMVDKPVILSLNTENFKLLTIVLVVPTETIGFPKTSLTLDDIVGSLKFNISFTL